jgi:hypothetical protein
MIFLTSFAAFVSIALLCVTINVIRESFTGNNQ